MIRKTHHPMWNEDFQFMLEEPPLNDKIHIEVMSKRTRFSFRSKVCLVILLLSPQFSSLISKKIHVEYLHCVGVVGVCGNQSRRRGAQRTHQPEIPFDRLEEWSGTR